MFVILRNVLDSALIERAREASCEFITGTNQNRHFVSRGKNFFATQEGFPLLRELVLELRSKTSLLRQYKKPYVDHAYLLFKSPGGNATPPHQDRPFWFNREKDNDNVSMLTAWVPLEPMNERNGCLLVPDSEAAHDIKELNSKPFVYEHVSDGSEKDAGNFSFIINESDAAKLSLSPVRMEVSDLLVFDPFCVHASAPNNSLEARKALKIVFREGAGSVAVEDLIDRPRITLFSIQAKMYWGSLKSVLSRLRGRTGAM